MRKFLLPILNLINLILISIVWGLSKQTAVIDQQYNDAPRGIYYQVVWGGTKANVVAIIGFFLFIFACVATLAAFLPIKPRKFITCAGGLMYIGAGVMFLLGPNPKFYDCSIIDFKLTGAMIAMAVLVFIAGFFSLLMSLIEFRAKEEK